jgi:hypothetical protein
VIGELTPLSHPPFPQTHSIKNFEIAILFNVVESSGNYDFEDDKPPKPIRPRVLSCTLGHIRFL